MKSIGFGLERLGKIALRWPELASAVVIVLCILTGYGITHLGFDSSVRDVFRTSRPEFARYQKFLDRFSDIGADTFVVFEGKRLDRHLGALRDIALEAGILDHVTGIVSLFSLRTLDADGGIGPPLFPADLPAGEALDALLKRADAHPLNRGRLFSADRGALVLVLNIERSDDPKATFIAVDSQLRQLFAETLPKGVNATVTGLAAMHRYVVDELERDVIVLNAVGLVLAVIIGLITLGNVWAALITALPPVVAVLWMLGGMGLAGVSINLITNVLPVLILILAFADSMHLTYEVRRYRRNDATSARRAAYRTVARVGPACVLAGLTTMVAFLTLALSDSALIRSFGQTGLLAVLGAVIAVIVVHPLAIYWLGKLGLAKSWTEPHMARRIVSLRGLSRRCAAFTGRWPRGIALVGTLAAITFGAIHLQVRPSYSFLENVPQASEAFRALSVIETRLGGGHTIYLPVELDREGSLGNPENIRKLNEITKVVEAAAAPNDVLSPALLARWLDPGTPERASGRIRDLLAETGAAGRSRLVSHAGKQALISIRLADEGSAETRALIGRIEAALAKAFPDAKPPLRITGHMALSAQTGEWMLGRLNYSLLAAVVLSIAIISFAFRSVSAGLYALVPNLLPILAAGTALYLSGRGLQFTSAIALTIAFGIAVDDTIHFLSAYRYGRRDHPSVRDALAHAYERAGPAMIATTAILCAGLLVSLISNLPMVHLFGWLSALTLAIALVADMIVLPAIIAAVGERRQRS